MVSSGIISPIRLRPFQKFLKARKQQGRLSRDDDPCCRGGHKTLVMFAPRKDSTVAAKRRVVVVNGQKKTKTKTQCVAFNLGANSFHESAVVAYLNKARQHEHDSLDDASSSSSSSSSLWYSMSDIDEFRERNDRDSARIEYLCRKRDMQPDQGKPSERMQKHKAFVFRERLERALFSGHHNCRPEQQPPESSSIRNHTRGIRTPCFEFIGLERCVSKTTMNNRRRCVVRAVLETQNCCKQLQHDSPTNDNDKGNNPGNRHRLLEAEHAIRQASLTMGAGSASIAHAVAQMAIQLE